MFHKSILAAGFLAITACTVPIGTTKSTFHETAKPVAAGNIAVRARNAAFVQTAEAKFNALRAAQGLGPVRFDETLAKSAEVHARDMAINGFRSHAGSDGSNFVARAKRVGASCAKGENLAWGFRQSDGAFDWWLNSPPHRANLMQGSIAKFGLAEVNRIWVLVTGRNC